MTTTTLFSNNRFMSMYKASLLRLRSLIVFYTAISFFFFPVQYLLTAMKHMKDGYEFTDFVGITGLYTPVTLVVFSGLMFLIPLIAGTQVYSDMHSKKAVDLYHSLPVTREITMLARFSAAMTAITVPLVFNYVVTLIMQSFYTHSFPIRYALGDMLCWFAVCFTMLAILSFVATQVGTVFDTIIMTLGLYCVLPFLYLTIMSICETFVYGYSINSGMNENLLLNLSPIPLIIKRFAISDMYRYSFDGTRDSLINAELGANGIAIIVWFIIGICLLFVATKFYQKRQSEQAETTDSKGILKVILKLSGTFIAAILMGYLFYAMFDTISYFYFGAVAGTIMAYLIIEIILSRGFKGILKAIPTSIISSVVVAGFVFMLSNGAFGYEGRIPTIDKVQSITIDYRGAYGGYNERVPRDIYGYSTMRNVTLESDEAKQIILDAHKQQIELQKQGEWKNEVKYVNYYNSGINITYTMKNGKDMYRDYRSTYNIVSAKLAELETNDEFITKTHPIFRTDYKDVEDISISNSLGRRETVDINEVQFDKLKTAIQTDLLNETYEQRIDAKIPLGFIEINYRDYDRNRYGEAVEKRTTNWFSSGYYIVSENSVNTLAIISENGWEDYIKTDFTSIETIYIGNDGDSKQESKFITQMNINELIIADYENSQFDDNNEYNDAYITKDKSKISQLLGVARVSILDEERIVYMIIKPLDARKNDAMVSYAIRYDDLPKDIQQKIENYYQSRTVDKYGNVTYATYDKDAVANEAIMENSAVTFQDTNETLSVGVID